MSNIKGGNVYYDLKGKSIKNNDSIVLNNFNTNVRNKKTIILTNFKINETSEIIYNMVFNSYVGDDFMPCISSTYAGYVNSQSLMIIEIDSKAPIENDYNEVLVYIHEIQYTA